MRELRAACSIVSAHFHFQPPADSRSAGKGLKNILRSQITALYLLSNDCIMKTRRDIFQAIADPTRRAILTLVALQAMTPGAIADSFDSSRQTISKHIQILTECQLLKQENSGREIYYHFNPNKMKEVAEWLLPFAKIWDDRFNKLEAVMKKFIIKK
jgi:DNA-binding transcriptional ArsR family regulator